MQRTAASAVSLAFLLWADQWLLLTSGDFAKGEFNAMAVGWGSLGTMWGKPFAQVVVRPGRHTRGFMERYNTFTLCAFLTRGSSAPSCGETEWSPGRA